MNYVSTRGQATPLDFEEVLLAGLARDGGLYVPESWPTLDADAIAGFRGKPYGDVAHAVMRPFIGDAVSDGDLAAMIGEAYAGFDRQEIAPLRDLGDGLHLLELFHGPTLAFKDIAMQVLARLMDHVLEKRGQRITIVGATSGDTGGAAIEAFRGREASDIFILFPHGRVSEVQRRQMTTVGDANVHNIAIEGTFDDCQALLKAMFSDLAYRDRLGLAGVNSVNWARVMAQIVYYFTAAVQLGGPERPVDFTVPTGNFGDIFAGFCAWRMGLPVGRLTAATNINDILVRTLKTGRYELRDVMATQSPSMDIQVSSSFERLLFDAYGRDAGAVRTLMADLARTRAFDIAPEPLARIARLFCATRTDEAETARTIARIHREKDILLDPHSAVGVHAALALAGTSENPHVVLATAHPAKFPDAVEKASGVRPALPPRLGDLLQREERYEVLPADLETVEAHIAERARAL